MQIGKVVGHIAGGILGARQHRRHFLKQRDAVPDQKSRGNDDTFLDQMMCLGGHGSGRHPAYLGVMSPVGDVAEKTVCIVKDRGDQRDIGQVRASEGRMIGDAGVAGLKGREALDNFTHANTKRPQVHRDMRGAGNEQTPRIKQSAGKIQALADVR